jgi:hypothetical protein
MGPKTLPTIWGTYMKHVTKYQISAINSCWEKCDEKWAYMFNVYKNQQSRQTGSRNLMGPKMLPMIWGTDMDLVTKYQISAINSCWEKCDEKLAYTVDSRYLEFDGTMEKIRLKRSYENTGSVVLVPSCRKPYYLHSLSQIYLSKHVYYLGIKIGSQVKHLVIDFDIFTFGYFTCLFHNLSN